MVGWDSSLCGSPHRFVSPAVGWGTPLRAPITTRGSWLSLGTETLGLWSPRMGTWLRGPFQGLGPLATPFGAPDYASWGAMLRAGGEVMMWRCFALGCPRWGAGELPTWPESWLEVPRRCFEPAAQFGASWVSGRWLGDHQGGLRDLGERPLSAPTSFARCRRGPGAWPPTAGWVYQVEGEQRGLCPAGSQPSVASASG